jgi:hypothetical protein
MASRLSIYPRVAKTYEMRFIFFGSALGHAFVRGEDSDPRRGPGLEKLE